MLCYVMLCYVMLCCAAMVQYAAIQRSGCEFKSGTVKERNTVDGEGNGKPPQELHFPEKRRLRLHCTRSLLIPYKSVTDQSCVYTR